MKITLSFISLIIICIHFSCVNGNIHKGTLQAAINEMEINPDSSYLILQQIEEPSKMSQRDYALYCLLLTQASEKKSRPLLSDSLINISLDYYKKEGNDNMLAKSYFYAGRVNEEMLNPLKALEYYLYAIDLLDDSDENYRLLFLCHYYLGNLYSEQELFDDELLMHKRAYYYSDKLGDSINIAYALHAIGTTFLEKEKIDSALYYHNKALLWIHPDDSVSLSYIFNSIAVSYDRLGKYDLALKYANKSQLIQPDANELFYNYILKGQIFIHTNKLDSAENNFNKSIYSNNLYTKTASYEGLAEILECRGEYEMALLHRKKYDICRDSLEMQLKTSTVMTLQKIYQNEKLKDENYNLKLLKLEQDKRTYRISLLLVSIILFISYSYYKYRIKKENKIKLQEEIIKKKQQEVQQSALMQLKVEQKLLVLQQKEMLLRESFFNRLITVTGLSLNTKDTDHIKLSDKDWDNIIENVNIAFDGFTIKLKERYSELTNQDIRFCCLLKMKLSVNDLVAIYCLDRKSIYKKKERIKKDRMHLVDKRSLNEILESFPEEF